MDSKSSTSSLSQDSLSGLNALDYAGVVLTGLKSIAGVAPFGSQIQACLDIAQAIVDNVKVRRKHIFIKRLDDSSMLCE